mgnify:CR=1 FL=1
MWLKSLILFSFLGLSTLKFIKNEIKIDEIVCSAINEVLRNESTTTVVFVTDENDSQNILRSNIHQCLSNDAIRVEMLVKNLTKNVILPESSIYVVISDHLDLVSN